MTSRKRTRAHSCARNSEPTWLKDELSTGRGRVAETKTIQLARQVEEALCCAFASSTSAHLRDLIVVAVQPVRGVALLRVLVTTEGEEETHCYEDVRDALARARGYLRGEVARAIHRKRVPSLEFAIVPSTEVGFGEEDEYER